MANNVKSAENLTWHQTRAEIEARAEAEAEIIPDRPAQLKPPKSLKGDRAALSYWKSITERMQGLAILDDLDVEMLAIYVTSLSRRDDLQKQCRQMMNLALREEDPETKLAMLGKLESLIGRVQAHEKTLLSYANVLGMTPEARVRLARKRAAKAVEVEPDGDLFGD